MHNVDPTPQPETRRISRHTDLLIAREISRITRHYDHIYRWRPLSHDPGTVFEHIEAKSKTTLPPHAPFPDLRGEIDIRSAILLNGDFNHSLDIQNLLTVLEAKCSRTTRIIAVSYNPYLGGLYRLANRLGFRRAELPQTFLTMTDLNNLAKLSGFECVRIQPAVFFPWKLLRLGDFLNGLLATLPGSRWLGLAWVIVLRPSRPSQTGRPSLSVVVPARNEKGNVENVLARLPDLGIPIEVIWVEGHSTDGTWEEIQRVIPKYCDRFSLKALKQTGEGKCDAVRTGLEHVSADLVAILDADLTMPAELLGRFYEAYRTGLADFINGTRLVYPMEGSAMRFLNRLGNTFFAKMVSFVLDMRIGDTLCGTKLFARHDYLRMLAWRRRFGDFDPFGDFELLFPAAVLGLGVVDVPVRYRARTYGSTSIRRFRHGWMLFKMVVVGWWRLRTGRA